MAARVHTPGRQRWPRRIGVAAGLYAIAVGTATLVGWGEHIPRLTTWHNGISMFPNTAVAAIGAGLAVLLLACGYGRLGALAGAVAGVIGGATLYQHLAGVDLGIDRLLFSSDFGQRAAAAAAAPMRMGPPASTAFTILGASAVLSLLGGPGRSFAALGGLAGTAIAGLSLIGYLYGVDTLYSLPRLTGIAVQTSSVLLVLGVGLVATLPDTEPMRTLRADSAAGALVRRALPLVILLPIVLGWLRLVGQWAGLYDTEFGAALRTLVEVGLLSVLLWWAAQAVRAHEARLREASHRLEGVLASISDQFLTVDRGWRITYCNAAMRRILAEHGVEVAAALGRDLFEALPGFGTGAGASYLRRAMQERVDVSYEIFHEFWQRWFSVRAAPTPDGGLAILTLDISDRVRAQAELRRSERRLAGELNAAQRLQAVSTRLIQSGGVAELYETILDAAVAIMGSQFGSLQVLDHTSGEGGELRLVAFRGFTPEAASFWERVRPSARSSCAVALRVGQRVIVPDTLACEFMAGTADLDMFRAAEIRGMQSTPLLSRSGAMLGMISTHWEEPHEPSPEALRLLDVLARQAADVVERNRVHEELADREKHLARLVAERTSELEHAHIHLRHTERLAAMGTLAAGLGHDLGNLMLPLRMRLDALERQELLPAVREEVAAIRNGLTYLQRLSASLRQMAADPAAPPPAEGTDLARWSEEAAAVMRAALPRGAHLECEIPGGLPPVNASAAGLTQAVFNLVQNAQEAMTGAPTRDGSAGLIRIGARPSTVHAGWVELTVSDNGPGMTPEVAARCFEPYFSTKGRAVSTGLGLALVRGVAQTAGGSVECVATPGKGAAFTLQLPPARARRTGEPAGAPLRAVVDVREPRLALVAATVLRSMGVEPRAGDGTPPRGAPLWVTDHQPAERLEEFVRDGSPDVAGVPSPGRGVVVLRAGKDLFDRAGCVVHAGGWDGAASSVRAVRAAMEKAIACSLRRDGSNGDGRSSGAPGAGAAATRYEGPAL